MITSPEKNVKFTDEQDRQLETWKGRVSVLNEEILLAEKKLKVLKEDTAKAVKEKEYQKKELSNVLEEKGKLLGERDALAIEITKSAQKFKEQDTENAEIVKVLDARVVDIKEKEKALVSRSSELDKKSEQLAKQEAKLEVKKERVDKAEKILRSALDTAWK